MESESGRIDWRSDVARVRPIADLRALFDLVENAAEASDRGCWPASEGKSKRACWPDPDDLRVGEPKPAERIRKATRGRLF